MSAYHVISVYSYIEELNCMVNHLAHNHTECFQSIALTEVASDRLQLSSMHILCNAANGLLCYSQAETYLQCAKSKQQNRLLIS